MRFLLFLFIPCFALGADLLQVSGHGLVYQDKLIHLQGVAVGDVILAREGRPLSDYQEIAKNWNSNAVRMGIHPMVWKSKKHEVVLDELEKQAKAALDAGLFVIIDWHVIGWPDGYFEKPDLSWGSPEDLYDSNFKLAMDFWTQVSQRFGKDGRIIFELWNEPVFQKDSERKKGKSKWKELKPYFEKLLSAIRVHGKNLVLATGDHWAYNMHGIKDDLIADANCAYAWHIYAGHDSNNENRWAEALDGLDKIRPVLVTEWGFQEKTKDHFRGTADDFGKKFTNNFLEKRQLSYTAWCWHPDWTPNLLESDWRTPTSFGKFVQDYLKKTHADHP